LKRSRADFSHKSFEYWKVSRAAFVMAGLVPAIHVFLAAGCKDVDARDKPGHDDFHGALRYATAVR
jgi:hypothetical protein